MPLDREAGRRELLEITGAVVHVEHALAGPALKVVMVRVAGRLVARRLAGQGHRLDLAGLGQELEIAIDGRHAQRRHFALRHFENFGRQQRTCGGIDHGADRGTLAGGALFHRGSLSGAQAAPETKNP